jgi:hypothetical protein
MNKTKNSKNDWSYQSNLLPMSGLRPQFLGSALGALRSIGRTNRREDKIEILGTTAPRGCRHIESAGTFDRPFDPLLLASSGRAGAAYGAVHRARGSYDGFLLKLVLARQKLW